MRPQQLQRPELVGLSTAMLLYYNAHEALQGVFVIYTDYRYHWSTPLYGAGAGGCWRGFLRCCRPLLISLAIKLGELRTLYCGLLCGLAGFALFAAAPSTPIFVIGIPLLSLWGLATRNSSPLCSLRPGLLRSLLLFLSRSVHLRLLYFVSTENFLASLTHKIRFARR